MPNTDKKLIPTENIPKNITPVIIERFKTSVWIDAKTHKAFIEACDLIGRKTCNVLESFEKGFVKCVKKSVVLENLDVCSVKPVVFNNMILNISEKYAKRGPKMNKSLDPVVVCPLSGKSVPIEGPAVFTCKWECNFHVGCLVYERARFQ